jgi:hypothetical protein
MGRTRSREMEISLKAAKGGHSVLERGAPACRHRLFDAWENPRFLSVSDVGRSTLRPWTEQKTTASRVSFLEEKNSRNKPNWVLVCSAGTRKQTHSNPIFWLSDAAAVGTACLRSARGRTRRSAPYKTDRVFTGTFTVAAGFASGRNTLVRSSSLSRNSKSAGRGTVSPKTSSSALTKGREWGNCPPGPKFSPVLSLPRAFRRVLVQ